MLRIEAATRVFCSKKVHRNFSKFTGKHLCQSLFFNKVAGLRPQTTFFTEHLRTTAPPRYNVIKYLVEAKVLSNTRGRVGV